MIRNRDIVILALLFVGVATVVERVDLWKLVGLPHPNGYITQGLIFLGVFWILKTFLFEPYLHVVDERENETTRKREAAEKTRQTAESMLAKYRASIESTKLNASRERESMALQAEAHEREVLQETKEAARRASAGAMERMKTEASAAAKELKREVEPLSDEIMAKILGEAGGKPSPRRRGPIQMANET